MLCRRVLKPCSTYVYRLQPARTFWPLAGSVMKQVEDDLQRHMEDMKRTVLQMEEAHSHLRGESLAGLTGGKLGSTQDAREPEAESPSDGKDGFAVSLDVSRFTPEELTVKVLGKTVSVAGRRQEVQGKDEDGIRSYEYMEFRKVFDLPSNINSDAVSCRWSKDGKLHIEAPSLALPSEKEQSIPIDKDAKD